MVKIENVRKVQKEVSRLIVALEALEGFQGGEADRRAFERQVRTVSASVAESVQSAGITAAKEPRTLRKSAPGVKAWRSAHMSLLVAVRKTAIGSPERAAAQAAYNEWRVANPVLSSKK